MELMFIESFNLIELNSIPLQNNIDVINFVTFVYVKTLVSRWKTNLRLCEKFCCFDKPISWSIFRVAIKVESNFQDVKQR